MWKPFPKKTIKTYFYKFVGTNLLETSISYVVCRHRPTGDTNPHNCFFCRHQPTYKFMSSSYAFPSLVCLMLLSSPNLFCARYFYFHHICSTLVASAFTKYVLCSLLLLLTDQLDTQSFCFRQICSALAPSTFPRSINWIITYFFTLSFLNNVQSFLILYSHM
jgi:hypothetical protein